MNFADLTLGKRSALEHRARVWSVIIIALFKICTLYNKLFSIAKTIRLKFINHKNDEFLKSI
jgi:hypothetical protein